jgi:DNA-binding CsgD family transcriptional regulator
MERERQRADISNEAVRRLNFAWITLGAGGEILEMDEQAKRLLGRASLLGSDARGHLRITLSHGANAIQDALQVVTASTNPRSRAIHLSDQPWLDMLMVPIRDKPISGARTPAAVGYIHGDAATGSHRREQLSELFGLNRSEAILALALCQGLSIAEAATAQGLTIETARNYTKRIYFKTGTRGQADLVRVILGSVIALA